jgi:rRNA-processing protein FCF1
VDKLPTKVLCDTNFLLIPIRFGVDILAETTEAVNDIVEFYVSSKVVEEIKLLIFNAKPGLERELRFALNMANRFKIIEDDSSLSVDDSLIQLAEKNNMILGTVDKELRKKAKKSGVKVVFLRQGRRLLLDG